MRREQLGRRGASRACLESLLRTTLASVLVRNGSPTHGTSFRRTAIVWRTCRSASPGLGLDLEATDAARRRGTSPRKCWTTRPTARRRSRVRTRHCSSSRCAAPGASLGRGFRAPPPLARARPRLRGHRRWQTSLELLRCGQQSLQHGWRSDLAQPQAAPLRRRLRQRQLSPRPRSPRLHKTQTQNQRQDAALRMC